MKPDVKKIIIMNLPYLLFVYVFGKLGEAYRLAAEADLTQKMLHFMDSLAAAFANGKTRFFVKPNLMQMHSSYCITDPKGSLLIEVDQLLRRQSNNNISEIMEVNLGSFLTAQSTFCRPSLSPWAAVCACGAASISWRTTGRTTLVLNRRA